MATPKLSPALEQAPPQAFEAEQGVLGCIMLDTQGVALPAARKILRPSDFYRAQHRRIFEVACSLEDAGKPCDVLMIADELDRLGLLDQVDGRPYLVSLLEVPPAVARVPHYCDRVLETSLKRQLIATAGEVMGAAYNGVGPAQLTDWSAKIARLTSSLASPGEAGAYLGPHLETVAFSDLMRMEFEPLRWAVQGLIPEGLTVWAGRSKVGKSFAIYEIAYAVATGGIALSKVPVDKGDVLYLALEDPQRRLKERGERFIEDGTTPPPNLFLATSAPTLDEGTLGAIEEFLDGHPTTRLVIIDTLARVRHEEKNQGGGVYWSESRMIARIQSMALKRKVAVVLMHHTNKLNPKMLGDPFDAISGSLGIQTPCDALILFWRVPEEKTAKVHIRGREFEDATLILEWSDRGGWILVGNAEEHFRTRSQVDSLAVLTRAGTGADLHRYPVQTQRYAKSVRTL